MWKNSKHFIKDMWVLPRAGVVTYLIFALKKINHWLDVFAGFAEDATNGRRRTVPCPVDGHAGGG
jgi:hypothetical protein